MTTVARFGTIDRLALQLFEQLADLVQNDEWDEIFEDQVFQQTDFDPDDNTTDEAMDEFYEQVENFRDRVLERLGHALVAHRRKTGDKIVREYYRKQSELAQQT